MGDWKLSARSGKNGKWELYNLKVDRCESNDLASKYPERVKQLAQQWADIAEGFRKYLNRK